MAPLNEATQLHGSRERRDKIIPPNVRGPHYGISGRAAREKVAEIGGELESGLSAEIPEAAVGREVVRKAVDAKCHAASTDMNRRPVSEREAIHKARGESAHLYIAAGSVGYMTKEVRSCL